MANRQMGGTSKGLRFPKHTTLRIDPTFQKNIMEVTYLRVGSKPHLRSQNVWEHKGAKRKTYHPKEHEVTIWHGPQGPQMRACQLQCR